MLPVTQITSDTLQAGEAIFRIGQTIDLTEEEQTALNNVRQAYLDFRQAQSDMYSLIHRMDHEYDPRLQDAFFDHREQHRNLKNAEEDVTMMILRRLNAPLPVVLLLDNDPPQVIIRQPSSTDQLVVDRNLIANVTGFNMHIGEARVMLYGMMQTPSVHDIQLDHSDWVRYATPFVEANVRAEFRQIREDQSPDLFDGAMTDALNAVLNQGGVAQMLHNNRNLRPGQQPYSFPYTVLVYNDETCRSLNADAKFIPSTTPGSNVFEKMLNLVQRHITDLQARTFLLVRVAQLADPNDPEARPVPGFLVTLVNKIGDTISVRARGYEIVAQFSEENENVIASAEATLRYTYNNNGSTVNDTLFSSAMRSALSVVRPTPVPAPEEVEAEVVDPAETDSVS